MLNTQLCCTALKERNHISFLNCSGNRVKQHVNIATKYGRPSQNTMYFKSLRRLTYCLSQNTKCREIEKNVSEISWKSHYHLYIASDYFQVNINFKAMYGRTEISLELCPSENWNGCSGFQLFIHHKYSVLNTLKNIFRYIDS